MQKKPSPCRKEKTERGYVGMENVWGGIPVYPQVFGVNSSSMITYFQLRLDLVFVLPQTFVHWHSTTENRIP